jgi:hypothetical protein
LSAYIIELFHSQLQIAEVTLEQSQDKDTSNQWKSLLNSLFDDEMSLKVEKSDMLNTDQFASD